MRKETAKIAKASRKGEPARAGRTETDGTAVYLHGHRIAWRTRTAWGTFLHVTLAGYGTVTTRERINGILETFGLGRHWGAVQRQHGQYLQTWGENGKPILVEWDPRDVATFTLTGSPEATPEVRRA